MAPLPFLAYKVLLIKEIFYGLLFKGVAGLIVFIEAGHIPKNWFYLALIIVVLFPLTTSILKFFKEVWPDSSGMVLVTMSVVKIFLIPLLVMLFFDKEHEDIEAFVIPTIISYLILLTLDTKWKIQWLSKQKF
ncbi:hypothetical protein ACT29H_03970 [Thermophagus sp. OGC60D27]|uniref:hypothetical protein n=1 Tax=Thermophagus sp. OGC60D27 TaxID=3458415 RepID=UPI0040380279